ncbi:MAG TPA: Rieske 2Fe-2S domain-containing protein [Acidimicrobiales bacterium]|nr:Rieske 2Fe-2S domain-containing protein [Acidimicrobiales bacterium]
MRDATRRTAPRRAPRSRAIARPASSEPARGSAPRALPLGMPPRGWLLAGWSLLPVRAFLAVTFLYAGFQKLMNPSFLDSSSPYSLHQQMIGYIRTSPIHWLLGQLLSYSTPLGVLMALGEIAVGLGVALGLWTRLAAIGGMLISLSLFLAVSFHSHPWYTGADIVFLFMFTPFVIAGAGGVLSLDARIARRVAAEEGLDDERVVPVSFAAAQRSCGAYDKGRCTAIPHRHCAPNGCPFLEGPRRSLPGGRVPDHVDRRTVVLGGVAAAAAATAGLVAAGAVAGAGRLASPKTTSSTQATLGGPSGTGGSTSPHGTLLGPSSSVPVGQAATFTVPSSGDPGLVLQPSQGQFVAYDAVCPHAGCTVNYFASSHLIACPCHGSEFDPATGSVIVGPATVGLTVLQVTEADGKLYVK